MIKNIELLNYIKENISLVRTMVIKIEDLALLDNNKMLTSLGLNSGDDKTKWRYYLNLNGEYHITDEMMYVKSLDNDEEIEFTKDNLKDHLATKKAYRLGSYYYARLAEKYSHQVDLIKGIINPIPTSESIPAKNGSILRYNTDYVNDNEILLISKVQDVINKFIYQTFNTEYKYTENLMMSFLVGRLHNVVLKEILVYRFENAFTRQAHPFYIWSHLQSCGISPIYKKVLNKEQTFWLFRNIEYILRNQGKDFTFKLLIENLLTKRDIPLLKYDLVHSTETMKEDLFPKPLYQVRRLNLVNSKGYMDELTTLPIAMTKEVPDAIDNEPTYEMYLAKTEDDGRDSYTSNYPIKLLESSMIDTTLRKPETIFHVINAELIYLAKNDIYNINLDIVEPISGNHFRFNVKEAITLWYGLLDKLNGCTSGKLGEIFYNKALKITPPTLNQLMDLSGPPFLTEAWCEDLLKTYIPQSRIISPIAFFNNAKAISDLKWTHEKMYSMFPSIGYYSRRKNACSTMYESGWVKLTDFKTLDELLDQKGISLKDYNDSDLENLIFELWNKMTGWSAAGYTTLGSIQQGLINLMKYLSSYSVQYIQNISVADGWYEGGLDLLTENPVNLGTDGEKPELDSGGDNFRIPIDIHVVTQNEVDKSIIGIIEESGFVFEGEVVGRSEIKQTPLLYPIEIEDDEPTGGILSMNGCLDQRCVPFTGKLPFDIEDFIPKGSALNNQHKTNSMLIDKLTGINKIGDWKVSNLSIVNNGLDNLFVSNEFNFQHIDDFVLLKTSSEKNTTDYYFSPASCESGKYVLKLEVMVRNDKTNEIVNVRFDYPIEIIESTHSVTFDIPESVNINEEFIITPKFTGLEIGDDYEFTDVIDSSGNEYLSLEPELNSYLKVRQENGVLYGNFIKPGWPKVLSLYLRSKLKYKSSSELNPYKDIYLHSIGNIPSDRYYNPIDDEEFIPKVRVREADINALVYDDFTVISEKKGWRVYSVVFKDNESNKNVVGRDYATDYGVIKDFIKPVYESPIIFEEDGKQYKKYPFWWASQEMGENRVEMITKVINDKTKEIIEIPWIMETTTYDHGITNTYSSYPPNGELPIDISTNCNIVISNMIPTVGLNMRVDLINNDPEHPVGYDFSRNGLNINTIIGLKVTPSGQVSNDIGFGIQIRVYPKRVNSTENLDCRHYSNFGFKKESIFDPNDFDVSEFGFKPWEVNNWRVNELIFDRLLAKERHNGWYVETIEHAKDENGNYLTEGIRTSYQRGSQLYDIPAPPPEIISRTGSDGRVSLPSPYKKVYGVGAVPIMDGELDLKLEVVFSNTYLGEKIKKEIITHKVSVLPDVFGMTIEPDLIIRKGEKVIDYTTTGYPLTDEVDDWEWDHDRGLFPGITAYASSDVVTNGDDKNFLFPEFTINRSNPGISIVLQSRHTHNKRNPSNSVAWYREYYTFSEFDSDSILDVYPPKFEDFNFKPKGVEWYKATTSCETFYFEKTDRYGWKVSTVELEIAGQPNESDYILRDFHGLQRTTMYRTGSIVNDKDVDGHSINSSTLMFTPKAVGEFQLNIKVTLTNPADPNNRVVQLIPYSYNVQDQNVGIEIAEERYFPLDIVVTTPYKIVNIPDGDKTYGLYGTAVGLDDSMSDYFKIDGAYNNGAMIIAKAIPPEGKRLYLIGTVLKRDPSHGQTSAPLFKDGTRVYYTEIEIPAKYLYDPNDMVIEDFDFQKDIAFPNRLLNEVYTDRWTHAAEYRGWKVYGITYDEGIPDYHIYNFRHEGSSYAIPVFNNWSVSQPKDISTLPPEGKLFMFSRFGLNKVGEYKWAMKIELRGSYHSGRKYLLLEVENGCVISNISLTHTFEDDQVLIGQKNQFKLSGKGVPPEDMGAWMAGTNTYFKAVGPEANKISVDVQLRTVTLPSNYNGNSFMLVHGIAYTTYQSSLVPPNFVRSETDRRYIATTDIIPSEKIILSKDLFEPTWFEREITQKTGSWIRFFTNFNIDGWEVQGIQPKGFHLNKVNEEQVMMKWNGEVIPQFYEEATNPNQFNVDGKKLSQRKSNTLIVPVQTGDEVEIDMEIRVRNKTTGLLWYVPFIYTGHVLPKVTTYPNISLPSGVEGYYIGKETLCDVRMNGWRPPIVNTADLKRFLAITLLGDPKPKVVANILKGDFEQTFNNAEITFNELVDKNTDFLIVAEYSPKRNLAEEGYISDGIRDTRFFGQTSIDKNKVIDPNDLSAFTPVPDIVYESYQPYEEVTDRYTLPLEYNGWTLKSVAFDKSVNDIAFTGFEGKKSITRPNAYISDNTNDATKKYLYLELTPLSSGNIVYPVNIIIEDDSGNQQTVVFNYTREVGPRTSYMTIPEKTIESGTSTTLPFTYIDHPAERLGAGLDVGGCIVESLDGLKDGESLSYRLYGRDMTVILAYGRTEDARYYVRWSYYWVSGPRAGINEIRNISYYSEINIAKEDITK